MDNSSLRVSSLFRIFIWLLVLLAHSTPAESRCSFRGKCGIDDGTDKERPCEYREEGQPLEPEGIEIISRMCPHLLETKEPRFCCDLPQLLNMEVELSQPDSLGMGKCPTCYSNFRKIFCGFCDPNHADYIAINQTEPSEEVPGKQTVLAVDYAVAEEFIEGAFNSCSSVQSVLAETTVMQLMCGVKQKDCTPRDWLHFLGSTAEENGFAPLKFNYIVTSEASVTASGVTLKPFNPTYYRCSDPFGPSKQKCSCGDCPEVCLPQTPPVLLPEPSPFTVGPYDGMLVVAILLFLLLSTATLIIFYLRGQKKKSSFRGRPRNTLRLLFFFLP